MEIKAKFWIENKGEVVLGVEKRPCFRRWTGWVLFNKPLMNLGCPIDMLGVRLEGSKIGLGSKLSIRNWEVRKEGAPD